MYPSRSILSSTDKKFSTYSFVKFSTMLNKTVHSLGPDKSVTGSYEGTYKRPERRTDSDLARLLLPVPPQRPRPSGPSSAAPGCHDSARDSDPLALSPGHSAFKLTCRSRACRSRRPGGARTTGKPPSRRGLWPYRLSTVVRSPAGVRGKIIRVTRPAHCTGPAGKKGTKVDKTHNGRLKLAQSMLCAKKLASTLFVPPHIHYKQVGSVSFELVC